MPNHIINRRVVLVSTPYDAEALALFARMAIQPSAARKQLISDFIKGIKSDLSIATLSGAFDCLWFTAGHNQADTLLNWVQNAYNLTEVNSPTWTLDRGYTGNGTTNYLNTNYNPNTNGVNFTLNNASAGVYARLEQNVNNAMMGCQRTAAPASYIFLRPRTTDNFSSYLNTASTSGISISNTSSLALSAVVRTASTGNEYFRRGVSIGTTTQTSVSVPSFNLFILANNGAGTADSFSANEAAFAYIGSGTLINQLNLYNRVQTYLTALGAQV